jgi:hypothetical protein
MPSGSSLLAATITLSKAEARLVRAASFVSLPRPRVDDGDGLDINPKAGRCQVAGSLRCNPRWRSNWVVLLAAVRPGNTELGIASAHAEPSPDPSWLRVARMGLLGR